MVVDLLSSLGLSRNTRDISPNMRTAYMLQQLAPNSNNGTVYGGLADALNKALIGYNVGADAGERRVAEQAIAEAYGAPQQQRQGLLSRLIGGKAPTMPSQEFAPRTDAEALRYLERTNPGNFYLNQQLEGMRLGQAKADQEAAALAREQAMADRQFGLQREQLDLTRQKMMQPEPVTYGAPMQVIDQRTGQPTLVRARSDGGFEPVTGYGAMPEATEQAAAPSTSFGGTNINNQAWGIVSSNLAKRQQGIALTPQEQADELAARNILSQPETMVKDGQLITIRPAVDVDKIFGAMQQTGGVPQQIANQQPQPGQVISQSVSPTDMTDFIIRQESGGNPNAVSSVGARGVMQLMPATAKEVATQLGLPYSQEMLNDPEYNRKLGEEYYRQQVNKYGSHVLALAAYNAGPGRVDQWLKSIGDPTRGEISEAEFINRIPFDETRNYVKNISGRFNESLANAGSTQAPGQFNVAQQQMAPEMPEVPQQAPQVPQQAPAAEKPRATVEALPLNPQQQIAADKRGRIAGEMLKRIEIAEGLLSDPENTVGGVTGEIASLFPGKSANILDQQMQAIKNQFTGANLAMMQGTGAISNTETQLLGELAGQIKPRMRRQEQLQTLAAIRAIMGMPEQSLPSEDPLNGRKVPEPSKAAVDQFNKVKAMDGVNPTDPGKVSVPDGRPTPSWGGDLPRPKTIAEAWKLKPGTKFIDPNGVIGTVPERAQ